MPGFPDGCPIERAEHPEAALDLEWVPCGEGLDGCVRLEDPPRDLRWVFADGRLYGDGEDGRFRISAKAPDRTTHALVSFDPDVEVRPSIYGAWRGPPPSMNTPQNCSMSALGSGPTHDMFSIFTWRKDEWPAEQRVYWAPHAGIADVTEPITILGADVLGQMSVNTPAVSSAGVALLKNSAFVMFVDDQRRYLFSPGEAPFTGQQQTPLSLVGEDDVFWSSWGNRVRVVHASREQETELFLDAGEGNDIHHFQTDSTDMAWYVGYNQSPETLRYERVELWTAPYTADPQAIQPRLVRVIDPEHGIQSARLGGGRWVVSRPAGDAATEYELWAYDLADGTRRHLVFNEDGQHILVHVSADEVLVYARRFEWQGSNRLFRIRIDSMPVVAD